MRARKTGRKTVYKHVVLRCQLHTMARSSLSVSQPSTKFKDRMVTTSPPIYNNCQAYKETHFVQSIPLIINDKASYSQDSTPIHLFHIATLFIASLPKCVANQTRPRSARAAAVQPACRAERKPATCGGDPQNNSSLLILGMLTNEFGHPLITKTKQTPFILVRPFLGEDGKAQRPSGLHALRQVTNYSIR